MNIDELRFSVSELQKRAVSDLERLVRIPSVGFDGYDPGPVRASAEMTADILSSAGFDGVRLIEIPGGHPAVFGELPGPDRTPRVLLYAHHDVQPEGPHDQWDSPPFEPTLREGRMYGRGT